MQSYYLDRILELKDSLIEKYPLQGNCNLEPPKLTLDITSSLSLLRKKNEMVIL